MVSDVFDWVLRNVIGLKIAHHMGKAHDEVAHVRVGFVTNVGGFVIVPEVLDVMNQMLVMAKVEVLLAMEGFHEVFQIVQDVHGGVVDVTV